MEQKPETELEFKDKLDNLYCPQSKNIYFNIYFNSSFISTIFIQQKE